ncbi:MAG TPA: carboxypeptidase-like regulatory domain-containing protein, partial [Pedobacter sp.]
MFSITGTIRDKKGEAIPGAAVYLSGYKIATVADNDGKFALANLKPGNYDLLVQVIGFLPQNKNVVLSDRTVKVDIALAENVTELSEVVNKADPNRQRYLSMFKSSFIGNTPNSKQCKILNPEVIQTNYDQSKRLLTVTATDFLIIENKALGYRI